MSGQGCSGEAGGPTSACPPGTVCQVNLTLLHTSDIHSRLLPYEQVITQIDANLGLGVLNSVSTVGGVGRLSYLIGRERAKADRVLHLDSGDCFQGAPIFNFFSGEPEVRTVSALGTDAAVLGNHEFDRGAENVTRQFQKWATFPLLAANYKFEAAPSQFGSIGTVTEPFQVFNQSGLKIAAIGMANLSSLTSIFDQPNRQGITPLTTTEVAQFYIDLLRPHVDLIVMVTHLGLEVDQRMVRGTTGIDVVLGGHNHVVINPPQELVDCSADPLNPGYVWAVDPNLDVGNGEPPKDDLHPDPLLHPWQFQRQCKPRKVLITHSGAFSKYLGRLDLVLSNDPKEISPTGDPADYDPINGFEVVSSRYTAFPVTADLPEDPVFVDMLQPYRRALDIAADLDLLVGYSPTGSRRNASSGGDSPLGNLVATAVWLRLGIQTDFSLTNSTGIRADLNPGPVNTEQMYNIFPFDNSISKMQLSGGEVQDLFDFVARRSANRGCSSQVQIAGARVRVNCTSCTRPEYRQKCTTNADCADVRGACDTAAGECRAACAEQIYIGHVEDSSTACGTNEDCGGSQCDTTTGHCLKQCATDADCGNLPGSCDLASGTGVGLCLSTVKPTNLYELATSNYLATGGSGYRVLQRNTTQFDTKIQQRDALIDYIRQGKPCGYDKKKGDLPSCSTDADCGTDGSHVCACPEHVSGPTGSPAVCTSDFSNGDCGEAGRCVLTACRDEVAQFHLKSCEGVRPEDRAQCETSLNPCVISGEECKVLSCVDENLGSVSDGRMEMIGR